MNTDCAQHVKIIALDLDDTLLDEKLSISDYTVDVLHKAAQQGIYIVLASGRADNAILPYVRQLDIAGTQQGRYIISQNGAAIFDLHTRSTIYSRTLDPEILIYVKNAAAAEGLLCQVYDASTIYAPQRNDWTDIDSRLSGLGIEIIDDFDDFLQQGHPKMVVPGDPEAIDVFRRKLIAHFGVRCGIFVSKPYFLEIMPPDTGKGQALKYLAHSLNIADGQTMAFGDSMNDESMIRYAHYSVAMKNGMDAIKDIARYTTDFTHNEDGAARFIESFCLSSLN